MGRAGTEDLMRMNVYEKQMVSLGALRGIPAQETLGCLVLEEGPFQAAAIPS